MNNIIYFSVNNWFCGRDYPPTDNFKKWLGDDLNQSFRSNEWCKQNKLCVYCGNIDMSMNYTVSAPREWVEKNCPELLTDKEYTYYTRQSDAKESVKQGKTVWITKEERGKYSDFIYTTQDDNDPPYDKFDQPFREYNEENFGSEWYDNDNAWYDEEDDEEENKYYQENE